MFVFDFIRRVPLVAPLPSAVAVAADDAPIASAYAVPTIERLLSTAVQDSLQVRSELCAAFLWSNWLFLIGWNSSRDLWSDLWPPSSSFHLKFCF